MVSPINMAVGISACFATVELGISACATLEEGGSIEQCAIELVGTEVRLSGMNGRGLVNVGVPAKEVVGGTIPIVGIPIGEGGWGGVKIGNCSSAVTIADTSNGACGMLSTCAGYYHPVPRC